MQRKKISSILKKTVWKKYFGDDSITGKCMFEGCNNILSLNVINSWHCGHILSVYNGGTNDLNNIKPICPECNANMGSCNWK